MQGFGVHTSMWTMNWDRAGAEKAVAAAAHYKMDFIEIALLNAPAVDTAHSRALLEKHHPCLRSLQFSIQAVRPAAVFCM